MSTDATTTGPPQQGGAGGHFPRGSRDSHPTLSTWGGAFPLFLLLGFPTGRGLPGPPLPREPHSRLPTGPGRGPPVSDSPSPWGRPASGVQPSRGAPTTAPMPPGSRCWVPGPLPSILVLWRLRSVLPPPLPSVLFCFFFPCCPSNPRIISFV